MDPFGKEGDGDEWMAEVSEDVSDFVGDMEEGRESECGELIRCELACPTIEDL